MEASTKMTHTLTFDEVERVDLARALDAVLEGEAGVNARSCVFDLLQVLRRLG